MSDPTCNPSTNEPPPHCPVVTVTPPPVEYSIPPGGEWSPIPFPGTTPPPTATEYATITEPGVDAVIALLMLAVLVGNLVLAARRR